jgi:selenocysteine lyase/cysteine desulfurase
MVKNPPYYLDLKKYKKSADKEGRAETPYTPAITLFYGMQEAMKIIKEEGMASRIAHHEEFPDYTDDELLAIARSMLAGMNYRFDEPAEAAFAEYLHTRRARPHFANARSVRNALDRIRMRQALRLFEQRGTSVTTDDLMLIREPEVRASRLFDTDAEDTGAASDPDPRTPDQA